LVFVFQFVGFDGEDGVIGLVFYLSVYNPYFEPLWLLAAKSSKTPGS